MVPRGAMPYLDLAINPTLQRAFNFSAPSRHYPEFDVHFRPPRAGIFNGDWADRESIEMY